ncbi:SRPBCC family protein [Chitinophaga polysaccharea]|uniref:SRPBCC family protein n=1 Tax=Chitinophaga polysaccharea TaxID=1293035 RepID=UPI00115BE229|nr:SRPBCC domain-containing protein [Chitinophaga polysaccharea]
MSKNLAFDFSVNKENKTITVKREFAAALPLVWDAYTKSEILDQWWAPKPWKARTKTMDFREGGSWHYAMVGPEGEEHWALANYKSIEDQKKFTIVDAFADEAGNPNTNMPQSQWEVSFTGKGDVTLVESVITYPDLAQLEATIKMGFKEGLTMGMENLDGLLPTLKK